MKATAQAISVLVALVICATHLWVRAAKDESSSEPDIFPDSGWVLTREDAISMTQKARDAAIAKGEDSIQVLVKNRDHIYLEAMEGMVEIADGMPLRLSADTITGGVIDVRLAFDPALATQDVALYASCESSRANWVRELFEAGFDNKILVISMSEPATFGMPVEVMAKLPRYLKADSLVVYNYNAAGRSYGLLENPDVWLDKNGFLHLTTTLAGELIVTDKPLAKKPW